MQCLQPLTTKAHEMHDNEQQSYLEKVPGGILLHIKLTPKASANKIVGVGAHETHRLKIMVTTVPEDGKANKALIKLLAKTLKLPQSALHLIRGETVREKTLKITGESQMLWEAITKRWG